MSSQSVEAKLEKFFSEYKTVTHNKGEIILSPAKEVQSVFFLKSGSVRMYAVSEEGEEITLHVFRPLSFFPIMLSFSNLKNKYYYQSIEESQIIRSPVEETLGFVKNDLEIMTDLTERFSLAIMGLLGRIETMAFQNAYIKVVSLIIYLAEKFGKTNSDGIIIPLSLNHQDIASWVSIRRETASRQLEKLNKNGLVKVKEQQFYIPDLEKLKLILLNH